MDKKGGGNPKRTGDPLNSLEWQIDHREGTNWMLVNFMEHKTRPNYDNNIQLLVNNSILTPPTTSDDGSPSDLKSGNSAQCQCGRNHYKERFNSFRAGHATGCQCGSPLSPPCLSVLLHLLILILLSDKGPFHPLVGLWCSCWWLNIPDGFIGG